MKKVFFALIMALACAVQGRAQTFTYEGINYRVSSITDKTVQVARNYNISGAVTLPAEVVYEESIYQVTSIGSDAFANCPLTSINIPNSVTSIGSYAFYYCFSLTTLTIPNSVTIIGSYAFYYCPLTSVTIPSSVRSIQHGAFSGSKSLTILTVESGNPNFDSRDNCNAIIVTATNTLIAGCKNTVIPNSVTKIDTNAFNDCSLTSINIPNSVTTIGGSAFRDCPLTSINIPNSVTSIGSNAFGGCPLTSINIPSSVTTIGGSAFSNCKSLKSVTLGNSVTSIGEMAFHYCEVLESVTLGKSVKTIGVRAFGNCYALTSIHLPDSVVSIGQDAFANCSALTSINLPNSLTTIGGNAFGGCRLLTTIDIPNSVTNIGHYAFANCPLTSIHIPSSVTSIEHGIFQGCTDLTSITVESGNPNYDSRNNCNAIIEKNTNALIAGCKTTVIPNSVTSIGVAAFDCNSALSSLIIPGAVTSIGNYAFQNCFGLTTLSSYIIEPFAVGKVFSGVDKKACTLYVPRGTTALYKATAGWKDFLHIAEFDLPTAIDDVKASPDGTSPVTAIYTLGGQKVTRTAPGRIYLYRHADGSTRKQVAL